MGALKVLLFCNGTNPQNIDTLLSSRGFKVIKTQEISEATRLAHAQCPNCFIMEWGPTNDNPLELSQWVRNDPKIKMTPILILSSNRDRPDDLMKAIEAGADDLLEQPISPIVFLSKISALMRRASWEDTQKHPPQLLHFKELTINSTARLATIEGKPIPLTFTEYELLVLFLTRKGEAIDRVGILSSISTHPDQVYFQVVDKHIENLRKKLGTSLGKHIETVRNVGYRFI